MSAHPTWDVPTRVFHWLLAAAVICSWASHEFNEPEIHIWSGYTVFVLVVFRLAWGFIGSIHSRFSDFLRGPGAILKYWRGETDAKPGHSPPGGWSVAALLLILLAQAITGLFNSDDLLLDGPFHYALDSKITDSIGAWHEYLFWGLSALISLHIAAIIYYQFVRKKNLIGPMVAGGTEGTEAPKPVWLALLIVCLASAALAVAIYFAPEPKLPW